MITLFEATPSDFKIIREIAYATWPDTYGDILSEKQITYMLDLFYSDKMLTKNVNQKNHRFLLAKEKETYLGFASYEHNYKQNKTTKIHKIYVLPEAQGKGIGRLLIDKMENLATESGMKAVSLNVNRHNKALTFYQKLGFQIISEEDINLDHGYLIEDYIMEKQL